MGYIDLLKEQEFYKKHFAFVEEKTNEMRKRYKKELSYSLINESIHKLITYEIISYIEGYYDIQTEFLRSKVEYLNLKIKFLESLSSNNEQVQIEKDIVNSKNELETATDLLKRLLQVTGKFNTDSDTIKDILEDTTIEKEDVFNKKNQDKSYKKDDDTFGFGILIEKNKNNELSDWYRYLEYMHTSPLKDFTINRNVMSNFKIIFKNPANGMYTDKENLVSLQYSTSKRKSPVFSIGRKTFAAHSYGVQLLAGSMVTLATDNVPLPYLHAISMSDHASVTDLPALDMYIIPIENIGDTGLYEILVIKGIRFIETKQNDNASSTGVYYAFNFFAEDVTPINSSEIKEKFKLTRKGNTSLT